MAIALDTNIIWPVLAGTELSASILTPLLEAYSVSDGLVIAEPVYAEALAGPGASVARLDAALARASITVEVRFGRVSSKVDAAIGVTETEEEVNVLFVRALRAQTESDVLRPTR
jgi:hypothetical protein